MRTAARERKGRKGIGEAREPNRSGADASSDQTWHAQGLLEQADVLLEVFVAEL